MSHVTWGVGPVDGTMSPARAIQQLWLQSWHHGQDQVARYQDASARARSLRC